MPAPACPPASGLSKAKVALPQDVNEDLQVRGKAPACSLHAACLPPAFSLLPFTSSMPPHAPQLGAGMQARRPHAGACQSLGMQLTVGHSTWMA